MSSIQAEIFYLILIAVGFVWSIVEICAEQPFDGLVLFLITYAFVSYRLAVKRIIYNKGMSTTNYQFKPYTIYEVEYSWLSKGETKVGHINVSANSEEQALKEVYDNTLASSSPEFKAKVINVTVHEKKK